MPAEPGDGGGRVSMRRMSCRRSLRDTIFEMERGVIGVMVRWSSWTSPPTGDSTIGEPDIVLRTGTGTAAVTSTRPAGASCESDATTFEGFEGYCELPGLTFSVNDGRPPVTALFARVSTGAGRDE
jgi:hypothetical protein